MLWERRAARDGSTRPDEHSPLLAKWRIKKSRKRHGDESPPKAVESRFVPAVAAHGEGATHKFVAICGVYIEGEGECFALGGVSPTAGFDRPKYIFVVEVVTNGEILLDL